VETFISEPVACPRWSCARNTRSGQAADRVTNRATIHDCFHMPRSMPILRRVKFDRGLVASNGRPQSPSDSRIRGSSGNFRSDAQSAAASGSGRNRRRAETRLNCRHRRSQYTALRSRDRAMPSTMFTGSSSTNSPSVRAGVHMCRTSSKQAQSQWKAVGYGS